jgi:hypothetical protein
MASILINTPLQRGVGKLAEGSNRFNGFYAVCGEWLETVKTVLISQSYHNTSLKRGVNKSGTRQQQE